jgi:hypothetical protein
MTLRLVRIVVVPIAAGAFLLGRGGRGITYRFARRWPIQPGVAYRACGHSLCRRAIR